MNLFSNQYTLFDSSRFSHYWLWIFDYKDVYQQANKHWDDDLHVEVAGSSPLCVSILLPTMFACWCTSLQVATHNQNDWRLMNQTECAGLRQDSNLKFVCKLFISPRSIFKVLENEKVISVHYAGSEQTRVFHNITVTCHLVFLASQPLMQTVLHLILLAVHSLMYGHHMISLIQSSFRIFVWA